MKVILFNANDQVRIIWRFISFIALFLLFSVPFQLGLREIFESGLLRTNLNRLFNVGGVIGAVYVLTRYIEKSSLSKYGLAIEGSWNKEFLIGCGIAVIQLTLFFAAMYGLGYLTITDYLATSSEDHSFLSGFLTELFVNLCASVSEEIIFRAFLFYIVFESLSKVVKNRATSAMITAVFVSQLFGFAHYGNDNATVYSSINLGFDALTICLPFLLTRRLGMSIGMHFAWNVTQAAIYGFANSGNLPKASIISSSMPDNMWTGGAFGPEGSVLLMAMDILAVLLILWWRRSQQIDYWVAPGFVDFDQE